VRSSTSITDDNVERVRVLLFRNWRITFEMLSEDLNISGEKVYYILYCFWENKGICKVRAALVSERAERAPCGSSHNFVGWADTHKNFLNKIVTGNKS